MIKYLLEYSPINIFLNFSTQSAFGGLRSGRSLRSDVISSFVVLSEVESALAEETSRNISL